MEEYHMDVNICFGPPEKSPHPERFAKMLNMISNMAPDVKVPDAIVLAHMMVEIETKAKG